MMRIFKIVLTCTLALCLVTISPANCLAQTQRSDYVVFGTVEQRGLIASQCPDVASPSIILKSSTGKLYYSRNAEEGVKIASLTKLATAYVAINSAPLDREIVVSSTAASVGGSSANLRAGDTMKLSEALSALLIPSGNDAAQAIAESIGKDLSSASDDEQACSVFVEKMNEAASEIGCTNTLFTNPHGLDADKFDSDAHSTASDVMKFVEKCMENTTIKGIVKLESAQITIENNSVQRTVELTTTDMLLGSLEGACGLKTGTTDEAGYCFAGACERDGELVYSVVLGAQSDASRWSDTESLFNWVFDNMVNYKLCNADDNTMAYVSHNEFLDKTIPATIANVNETIKVFKYDGNISQSMDLEPVSGDIKAGDKVGSVTFWQNNSPIITLDLLAKVDVSRPNIPDIIAIAFTRFIHIFTSEKNTADSEIINDTPVLIQYS